MWPHIFLCENGQYFFFGPNIMMIYTNLLFTFFSSGIEDNPTVFYKIIRGSTDQTNKYDTFYLQQRKEGDYTYADVKVNHPLDYERIKEYNLTVRVEVPIYFFKPPVVMAGLGRPGWLFLLFH